MIKMKDGIIIDAEKIVAISQGDSGFTQIDTVCGVFFATESPEEVARKVLEYRLTLERYRAKTADGKWGSSVFEQDILKELAGLEVESHE